MPWHPQEKQKLFINPKWDLSLLPHQEQLSSLVINPRGSHLPKAAIPGVGFPDQKLTQSLKVVESC